MKKRGAFTLIELLVVIAIIAILAAILFPVFAKAREQAKTSKCIAHGRELGQACLMYFNDYCDRVPSSVPQWMVNDLTRRINNRWDWPGSTRDETKDPWPMDLAQYKYIQLRKYVRNDAIWICPNPAGLYCTRYAYGFLCSWFFRAEDWWRPEEQRYRGFVDGDRGFQDKDGIGRTPGEVEALDAKGETACGSRNLPPTKKILWTCYAIGPWGTKWISAGDWLPTVFPSYPHNRGSIFVYVDGHAAWKKMGQAWAPVGYTKLWMDEDPGVP